MKEFLKNYKIGIIITITVFVALLAFTAIRYISAINIAEAAAKEKIQGIPEKEINDIGWTIPEIKEKKKEVHWLERTLALAKSDSLNLGISLTDSIVQVQLKGTVLLQAKMLHQDPYHFFDSLNYGTYLNFTKIATIFEEQANIVKRPVIRVQAPKNENEVKEVVKDTIPDPMLVWQFKLDNQIEVVVTGVGLDKDSVFNPQYQKDLKKYKTDLFKNNIMPKTYFPTLYIWLQDKDARAIYRAIPERGKVVFKN